MARESHTSEFGFCSAEGLPTERRHAEGAPCTHICGAVNNILDDHFYPLIWTPYVNEKINWNY